MLAHRDRPAGPAVEGRDLRRAAVLAGFAVLLVAQGAYSFLVGTEPYPAVRMPAFNGAARADGLFPTTSVAIELRFTDGSVVRPGVAELMSEFRPTARRPSLDRVFRPDATGRTRADDPQVRAWLTDRARALGGGREPESAAFCWTRGAVDVRAGVFVAAAPCESTRVEL